MITNDAAWDYRQAQNDAYDKPRVQGKQHCWRARKEYTCDLCRQRIKIGQFYYRQFTAVDDGKPIDAKWCSPSGQCLDRHGPGLFADAAA